MLNEVQAAIQEHERFAILTHIGPEGDALGAQLAMRLILKELGKQTFTISRDPVPASLEFLPGASDVHRPSALHGEQNYPTPKFLSTTRGPRPLRRLSWNHPCPRPPGDGRPLALTHLESILPAPLFAAGMSTWYHGWHRNSLLAGDGISGF